MNKLEQLHLDAIAQADYDPEDKVPNYVGFASKSAEITEQIAIEFSLWQQSGDCLYVLNDEDEWWNPYDDKERLTTKDLFQEFLKTKQ